MSGSEKEIDHINGNKDDNRWDNLRKATSLQNTAGRKMKKKRSFLRGVAELPSGRFRAVIGRNYKHIHLASLWGHARTKRTKNIVWG